MRGYFGIGVYGIKYEVNLGTLWRHAQLYGAAFIFVIGKRYKKQCSDTPRAFRHTPLFQFADWDTFKASRVYDCQIVAVELDERAVPLPEFEHPTRAIYLLGAEDNGISPARLKDAHHIVQIPSPGTQSMNVATAGTIIMYDRYQKHLTAAALK